MSLSRIFIDQKLLLKQHITLDSQASNYVVQVLRLGLNDSLLVFDGHSPGEFRACLTVINKRNAVITIEEFIACNKESPLAINLLQGVSRGEKMDFTIQKTVELGVSTITPVFTQYCNVKLSGERLISKIEHWQAVAVSAAQQSGRCLVPKILPAQDLITCFDPGFSYIHRCELVNSVSHDEAVQAERVVTNNLYLVLDPRAETRIAQIPQKPDCVTILVGPEGGLSDQEITLAKQNNFIPISLGPRILRTETAALTAISILQAKWGDL